MHMRGSTRTRVRVRGNTRGTEAAGHAGAGNGVRTQGHARGHMYAGQQRCSHVCGAARGGHRWQGRVGPATMPAREAARVRSGVRGTATTSVGMGGQDPRVTRDGYGVAAGWEIRHRTRTRGFAQTREPPYAVCSYSFAGFRCDYGFGFRRSYGLSCSLGRGNSHTCR